MEETLEYVDLGLPGEGDTVVVGMSGGVDSTLAAVLMKERGCRVVGATMSLWRGDLPALPEGTPPRHSCYGPDEAEDIEECREFCAANGIEHHVIDVKEAYRARVLEYFKAEYRAGRTPNPCVRCNSLVKFGAMLDGVRSLGIAFDYFCTGHYAKAVRPSQGLWGGGIRPAMVACAADATKDQAYFLCRVPSEVLENVRFPLGLTEKREVFRMARERGLKAAEREESQDFIPPEYFDSLFSDAPGVPGDIIDLDGRVLGRHRGIERYTVGQRKGLGVSSTRPLYVHSIDAARNLVVLAPSDALLCPSLVADDFTWAGGAEPPERFEADVKIRLASRPARAVVERLPPPEAGPRFVGAPWRITFREPQRAVAPGQSAAVYLDGAIVGGGIIALAER